MNNLFEKNEREPELLQLVTFNVGSEYYGIDISIVHEILRLIEVTKIPNSPKHIVGLVNLRNRIIPIIDLSFRLGFGNIASTSHSRIIVVEINEKKMGLIVDSVSEVLRIQKNILDEAPALTANKNSDFVKSIGKLDDSLLILLDVEKVIYNEIIEMKKAS